MVYGGCKLGENCKQFLSIIINSSHWNSNTNLIRSNKKLNAFLHLIDISSVTHTQVIFLERQRNHLNFLVISVLIIINGICLNPCQQDETRDCHNLLLILNLRLHHLFPLQWSSAVSQRKRKPAEECLGEGVSWPGNSNVRLTLDYILNYHPHLRIPFQVVLQSPRGWSLPS